MRHIMVVVLMALASNAWPTSQETLRQLNLFSEAFRYIRSKSARPVSDEVLIANAIEGMLAGIDGHSTYVTAEKYQELLGSLRGSFGGIGIEFTMKDGRPVVVSPLDETPASEAGIETGDILIEIEGTPLAGLSLSEIKDKLKGEIGEKITLKVERNNQSHTFSMKRRHINIKALKWSVEKGILMIRLSHFNQGIAGRVAALLKKQKDIKAVILDLTNNPGGIFEEALSVANLFLEKGMITSVEGRTAKDHQSFSAKPSKALLPTLPLYILVNKGTASSAEIVAAALKENNRATLVGEKTFGKGSVQTILPVPPGYTAIQLTTGLYKTPKGHLLDQQGVSPHIIIAESAEKSYQQTPKQAAIDLILKKQSHGKN